MDRLKELLETGGKALLLVAGICYVIGLLVINIHLSQFGFYSLNLLQLNYVTAGAWALVPILIVVYIISNVVDSFFDVLERERGSSWKVKTIVIPVGILLGIGTVSAILGRFVGSLGVTIGWNLLSVLGVAAVAAFFLLSAVAYLTSKETFSSFKSSVEALQLSFFSVFLFIFYLNYFARHLYKDLPAAFGGGRPHSVRLVVEPSAKPFLENAGIAFTSEINSEPLKLILSTDKEYVVLSNQSQNAVSVPEGLVKAVIFEKK